jgi:rhodanese-related sulfurtransferase
VEVSKRDSGLRLAELVAAFSLAMDLGLGQPMEHVLRSWRIAARLGDHIGVGMLEFRADPTSPYHQDGFDPHRRIILHCATGGRSALAAAALQDMGYQNVAHLDGGFKAWTEAGRPIEATN